MICIMEVNELFVVGIVFKFGEDWGFVVFFISVWYFDFLLCYYMFIISIIFSVI